MTKFSIELFSCSMTGKSLYEDSDEAKYNDYVIYDNPPAPPSIAPTS